MTNTEEVEIEIMQEYCFKVTKHALLDADKCQKKSLQYYNVSLY